MATPTGGEAGVCLRSLFDCLARGDLRELLGAIHDRAPDSLTRRDLATVLAPAYREKPLANSSGEEIERALIDLHHRHVPKLESAGLIDQDPDRGTVTRADHPAFRDPGVLDAIGDQEGTDGASLDGLFGSLAHPRRRAVLDVLSHQFGPIHTETLARGIGATELATAESDVPEEAVEGILATLRHVHLRDLSEAGLIEHDPDRGTVAYEGHPMLRVPWMHSVLAPGFRASLTGESETREIGTIQGREEVVSFGQSLCERADEELFCMFTDTDLLEAGCLTRIRDASRRGVAVYLGTRDETVREYVRENAPAVHLWEPQTSWLDVPVAGNRVGRLLLSDRDAVMLGTLGEETGDGVRREKSIIGEGADNTLVVMIRQLLRPYLDGIDEGAGDIEPRLPF